MIKSNRSCFSISTCIVIHICNRRRMYQISSSSSLFFTIILSIFTATITQNNVEPCVAFVTNGKINTSHVYYSFSSSSPTDGNGRKLSLIRNYNISLMRNKNLMKGQVNAIDHGSNDNLTRISTPSTPTITKSITQQLTNKNQIESSYNDDDYEKNGEAIIVNMEQIEQQEYELMNQISNYKKSQNNNNNNEKPALDSFIQLIENWLSFPKPNRAEAIIDKMEELYHVSGRIYERVINAWSFEAMESRLYDENINGDNNNDIERNHDSNNNNDTNNNGFESAKRAYNLLNRMEQLYEATGDLDFRPAISTYTSVINGIKRSTRTINENNEVYKKALSMMEQMRQQRDRVYNQSDIDKMDLISPHQVFYVLKYLENGDEVLRRLKKKNSNSNWIPIVNRCNFNIIINELANEGKPWASQAAEEILDCMIHCHVSTYKTLKPNIETINACMNAWAQCTARSDSAERTEGILKKLNNLQITEGLLLDVTPDTVSYNCIIKAHANSGNAKKAEEILNIMEDLYTSTKDEKIKPDLISFSSVLNAYAKSASYDQNAPRTAEKILMRMLKVQKDSEDGSNQIINVWSFNAVLNAYAAQGAGQRALLLLQLMEDLTERHDDNTIRPDTYSYNTVLKALARSKEKGSIGKALQILDRMEEKSDNGDLEVKPDGVSYNTVILAIANNGGQGSGKSAERILRRMEKQYYKGHEASKPTSATYTSLIKAWTCEKKFSTRRAEEIVNKLRKEASKQKGAVAPDTSIYNALLNCYAKSGERNAAKRAEEIIQMMLLEYSETGDESIKPNFRTYTTAIDVYSKSQVNGIAEKALGILEQMETLQENDSHLRPNVYTYAAVINCFARSKEADKAVRAVSILQQMEEQYRSGNDSARPNIVVYNSVLNACAYTTGERQNVETAFKIACLVFDEVRSSDYVQPTHVFYGTFIQICGNFMPESDIRDNLVEATFKRCAQEGLVSGFVWKKVSAAASSSLLQTLENLAKKDNNEAKWSRNS